MFLLIQCMESLKSLLSMLHTASNLCVSKAKTRTRMSSMQPQHTCQAMIYVKWQQQKRLILTQSASYILNYNGIEELNMIINPRFADNHRTLEELLQKYSAVLADNYEKQQNQLLQNLYQDAKLLKKELAVFKREVSSENIDKLINDKRREKERERELLENRWRQCNQSYKALQEQQKKLINQQKEDAFDLKNLRNKIDQFRLQIDEMKGKFDASRSYKQAKFMTETKENYHSFQTSTATSHMSRPKNNKLQKIQTNSDNMFFANKYQLSTCGPFQLHLQTRGDFGNTTESSRFDSQCLTRKEKNQRMVKQATERQNNLARFLNEPSVRLRLFKILKKQI